MDTRLEPSRCLEGGRQETSAGLLLPVEIRSRIQPREPHSLRSVQWRDRHQRQMMKPVKLPGVSTGSVAVVSVPLPRYSVPDLPWKEHWLRPRSVLYAPLDVLAKEFGQTADMCSRKLPLAAPCHPRYSWPDCAPFQSRSPATETVRPRRASRGRNPHSAFAGHDLRQGPHHHI